MKLTQLALAGLALASIGSAASAATYSFTGNTTSAPTYNRALAGTPPSGLSAVGTAVHYNALTFSVTASGSYDFLSTVTWDNFTFLYANSFNPSSALTNALIGNDDFTSTVGSLSGFTYALTAGSTYVFVTTGFANTDFGAFTDTITGPGNVIVGAVPEPGTYALMALGLGGLAFVRRRSVRARA